MNSPTVMATGYFPNVLPSRAEVAIRFSRNSTMIGGTSLIAPAFQIGPTGTEQVDEYVIVRTGVILAYERAILELELEVLHYKDLLFRMSQRSEDAEDYYTAQPVVPMDPASVSVLNSILEARISPSATYADVGEGDL